MQRNHTLYGRPGDVLPELGHGAFRRDGGVVPRRGKRHGVRVLPLIRGKYTTRGGFFSYWSPIRLLSGLLEIYSTSRWLLPPLLARSHVSNHRLDAVAAEAAR